MQLTSSSAVAKRQRDASCLSVVSFAASIVQYLERSYFIISYFSFGFTSAYNSILFCCLRGNIKLCCHTRTQSIVIVYSARARLVALALKNHGDGDFIARGAWWSNTRSIRPRYNCHNLRDAGRVPPATMFTTPHLLQHQQQAYRLRIAISAYPTCIRRPC